MMVRTFSCVLQSQELDLVYFIFPIDLIFLSLLKLLSPIVARLW